MHRVRQSLAAAFLLLGALLPALASAQPESAEEAVAAYIETLLARIEEIKPLYESDRRRYFDEVESALVEFVDFREVARGVMANYGTGPNGATPEQLDRFAEVFRASMVDFYGSALASYGGQEYEILESPASAPEAANAANVRMRVRADDGSDIELQYAMYLNAEGVWKLRNLYVQGINLRRQYYSRFDDLMARNGYDIDRVIDSWQVTE